MSFPTRRIRPKAAGLDEVAVMKRVALGDVGTLGISYDGYAPQLSRFVRRISEDRDAPDVVHMTFSPFAAESYAGDNE